MSIWLIPGIAASSSPVSGVRGRAKGVVETDEEPFSGAGWWLRTRGHPDAGVLVLAPRPDPKPFQFI